MLPCAADGPSVRVGAAAITLRTRHSGGLRTKAALTAEAAVAEPGTFTDACGAADISCVHARSSTVRPGLSLGQEFSCPGDES
jgi:hypothetical protein